MAADGEEAGAERQPGVGGRREDEEDAARLGREPLAGTKFGFSVEDKYVQITCPWGNQHRAYGPGPQWGDLTLGMPLRYGLGFMLGAEWLSLFGPGTPNAFGHYGFTNVVAWADPDRELAAALVTSGKPFLSIEVVRLLQCLGAIAREIPRA